MRRRQNQRGEDEAGRRRQPRSERYDWPSVGLFVIFLGTFVYALLRR